MWALALILLGLANACLNQDLNAKIVGGTTANIRNYPWQISLMFLTTHVCGGAILSENWAITTARCVTQHDLLDNNNLLMHIRAGSSFHDKDGTIHGLESVYVHPLFNSVMNYDYDIALIKVKTPFNFESVAAPVKLPPEGVAPPAGVNAHFTGWGSEKENGILSDQLKVVELPVLSIAKCRELYNYSYITLRMFCAGHEKGGKGFCSGDLGGPLVINGYLYGLASWSKGCANANYPGVFSHIGVLSTWIKQISNI